MANILATATGIDTSGRQKETHRLGSRSAQTEAATWRTKVNAHVNADGSGWVLVQRDGITLYKQEFGPE